MNFKSLSILASILIILVFGIYLYKSDGSEIHNKLNKIRAINAYNNKEYEFTQQYSLSYLKVDPNDVELHFLLGKSYMLSKFKNINKAIHHYEIFLNLLKSPIVIDAEKIHSMKSVGMHNSIKELVEKVNDSYIKAFILMDIEEDKAYSHLMKVPLEDRNKNYYELAAQLTFSLGKFVDSIEFSSNAINLGSLNKNLFYQRSQSFLREQRYAEAEKAIGVFELLEQLNPSIPLEQRIQYLSVYISKDVSLALKKLLLVKLAELLIEANNASVALEKLKEIDVSSLDQYQKLNLLIESSKLDNNELYDLISASVEDRHHNVGFSTIFCEYYSKNNKIESQSFCKNAVNKYPTNAPLNYWYSIALLKNDDLGQAIEFMHQAVDYAPWINIWRTQLAQLYLTNGDYEMAKSIINGALVKDNVIYQFKIKNGIE